MKSIVVVVTLAMATAALPGAARAQDKAAAEAAFDAANKLLADGKTAEACDAFARSQKLDAQFGTQYNLAGCYEKLGKTASAWSEYRALASLDTNPKRKQKSKENAARLASKLTKLLLTTRGGADGLVVTRNGQDVTASVGIESPVDPGEYAIAVEAPGRVDWSTTVQVSGVGATVTVEIPELEVAAVIDDGGKGGDELRLPPPQDDDDDGARDDNPAGIRDTPRPKSKRPLIGLSVAGAGVIAAGVGLVFGTQASSKWADAKELCGDDNVCPDQATLEMSQQLTDDAKSKAMLSTVCVGVGVAAIAGGVILWLTAPSSSASTEGNASLRVTPTVSDVQVGLALSGGF
jgi:hypothetical protein